MHFSTKSWGTESWGAKSWSLGRCLLPLLLILLCCFTQPAPLQAIVINIHVDRSDPSQHPSWDPNADILEQHAIAVANMWERLLPDNATWEIGVEWDDGLPFNQLGFSSGCIGPPICHIEFNSNRPDWFADPSFGPAPPIGLDPHAEFDFETKPVPNTNFFGSTIAADLSQSQRDAWFDGPSIPASLEVGFRGNALGGSDSTPTVTFPNLALGGALDDVRQKIDLLSVVLHEMGHDLGINDSSYEVNTAHTAGFDFDVAGVSESNHILAAPTLMQPTTPKGRRILPSALDVIVGADENNYATVDLLRKHYNGTGNWQTALNWIGGAVPGYQEDKAIVRFQSSATVSSQVGFVWELDVADQGQIVVSGSGGKLEVGDIRILGDDANIIVGGGTGELGARGDLLIDGGTLELWGGTAWSGREFRIDDNQVVNANSAGVVAGYGEILVGANTTPVWSNNPTLINNGLITTTLGSASPGEQLVIKDSMNVLGTVDLDGDREDQPGQSATGRVRVEWGDLEIWSDVTDSFDTGGAEPGILVGPGRTFTVRGDWTLGRNGVLQLNGGSFLDAAVVSDGNYSGTFIVHGDIEVPLGKRGHLETAVRLKADAEIDASGVLRLDGYTIFESPKITGYAIEQYGDALIEDNSEISAEVYDWDGDDGAPSTVTLAPLVSFLISPDPSRSEALRIDYADGYDGITYVNGGVLQVGTKEIQEDGDGNPVTVDAPWTIDGLDGSPAGTLQLANAAMGTEGATISGSILTGSAVIVKGTLRAMGTDNEIFSKHLTLEPGGAIELEGIAYQDLSAPGTPTVTDPGQLSMPAGGVTYSGGTITGAGSIHHEGPILVNGDVSAEVSTFDFDGQQTTLGNQINIQGGRLQVEAAALQYGTNTNLVSSNFEINNGALMISRVADPLAVGPPPEYLAWKLQSNREIELTGGATLSASDDLNNLAKFGSEMQVAGRVKASGSGNTIYAPTRVLFDGRVQVMQAGALELAGDVVVETGGQIEVIDGNLRISQNLNLEAGGSLHLQPSGVAALWGETRLQGGYFSGGGVLSQDGHLIVEQASTSYVKHFDLDGANDSMTFRLEDDFTIYAERLEALPGIAEREFNGEINVFAPATLTMDLPGGQGWRLRSPSIWIESDLGVMGDERGLTIAGDPVDLSSADGTQYSTFYVGNGSLVTFEADIKGIPKFLGSGGQVFNGKVSPGSSPGMIYSEGDVTFGSSAWLVMEIYRGLEADGSDPFGELYGTDPFDSFEVAGLIDLGGATLEVIFQDGFQPVAGQSFPLFSASSILGHFSTIIPRGLPQGLMLDSSGLSGGVLSVAVSPEPTAVLLLLLGLALLPCRRRTRVSR
jgi:hypothetical protein